MERPVWVVPLALHIPADTAEAAADYVHQLGDEPLTIRNQSGVEITAIWCNSPEDEAGVWTPYSLEDLSAEIERNRT